MSVFPGEDHPLSLRFRLEGLDMQVLFEDQSLSDSTKMEIFDDYNDVLSEFTPQGRYAIGNKRKFLINDKTINVNYRSFFSGQNVRLPDGHVNEYGLIGISEEGQEYLVIQKKLSDAYKLALDLKKERKIAFVELEKYINTMNNLGKADLHPLLTDLFYIKGTSLKVPEGEDNEATEEFRKAYIVYQYTQCNLLDFRIGEGEHSNKLITRIPLLDRESMKRTGEMPIIYDEGKWKIFIPGVPH